MKYSKIVQYEDYIEIKTFEEKKLLKISVDSVVAFMEVGENKSYFLKPNPNKEEEYSHIFLTRVEVGIISLYEKPFGKPDLYMEKGGMFEKFATERQTKKGRWEEVEQFSSFVSNDEESLRYIQSADFKFNYNEIVKVVQYYNRRNFIEEFPQSNDLMGKVYLYRTKFQKTKEGLKIRMHDQLHRLYINDFIILNVPIEYPSHLTINDGNISSTQVLSGKFEEQYYEILYDKKTNSFKFDPKDGTELRYEFHGIKDKVHKKMSDEKN